MTHAIKNNRQALSYTYYVRKSACRWILITELIPFGSVNDVLRESQLFVQRENVFMGPISTTSTNENLSDALRAKRSDTGTRPATTIAISFVHGVRAENVNCSFGSTVLRRRRRHGRDGRKFRDSTKRVRRNALGRPVRFLDTVRWHERCYTQRTEVTRVR